ncbi:DeoR/GlpR family DNA-binding transcription regulator [Microbacterium sp. cx-55]|uniref:DeoR/GlpR family DNA-binding transcription regulator n=1 Tax=unclassified Microbacterium TaxID=2609290 RepID=UPI001CBD068C|nr:MULTISPECIES: DeoR/GlpR family DNA-binding transcription regulator [unclassified Microbacterium]MBZ4487721.1 DeoR/GlpR family DNA-binding transcription regulator [Microbacterium sp. cx-55]MCC4908128.1 DeoR/GlpR family DNA-binding transcription regulator [Microbacterium sp. cx-59]UGB35731.1 DeoR/GlpR family DNA-binding transcription regulator [Microbacterium sp. cx-55]
MEAQNPERGRRLPAGRKADLAAYVRQFGRVTVADLAAHFGVSIDTIRRDLDQLDREGALVRTHGGAVSATEGPGRDRGLDVRLRMQVTEKDKIAKLAVELVKDGSVLMLNAGTTTLAVARALRNHRDLTIATNNLRVPSEISPTVFRDLYIFGGAVRTLTQATTGPVSLPMSATSPEVDIRCDIALVAVGAVDESGYSASNLGDASMMAEMVRRADRTAILADSTKLERRLFAQVAPLDGVDYLITDQEPPSGLAAALSAAGVTVLTP